MIGGNLVTRGLVGPRVVGGTWSVQGTWTLPAFTAGGDISMGANKLKTTNVLLKDATDGFQFRNIGDTAYSHLYAQDHYVYGALRFYTNTYYIASPDTDNNYISLRARDNTVGLVEIARLQGAADPEFKIGNNGNALRGSYAGLLGFFATAPQAKPTGVAVTAAGIHAALVSLGLIAA